MCKIDRRFREVDEQKQMVRRKAPVYHSHSTREWKRRKEEQEQEIDEQYEIWEKVAPVF